MVGGVRSFYFGMTSFFGRDQRDGRDGTLNSDPVDPVNPVQSSDVSLKSTLSVADWIRFQASRDLISIISLVFCQLAKIPPWGFWPLV